MNQQGNNPVDYQKVERFFSNGNLFQFIWKWKWVFVVTFLVAAVIGVVFSGPTFITPKYKSESILYPINLNEYGDENTTEQMLQLLQSTDLKFRLIEDFDLFKHYEIDPNDPHAHTYIFEEMNDRISFSKTNLESVRVTVLDKDPQQASDMVDSINVYYNQLAKSIHNLKTEERIERDSREMTKIQVENDTLKTKLRSLRQRIKIIDPDMQTEEITEAYLDNSREAGELYNNLVEYRDEIIFLDSLISFNNSRFIEYKDDHDEQVTELNRKLMYSSVVSKPIPADKKSYPIRWLILAGVVIAALVFAFIVLLILENLKVKRS